MHRSSSTRENSCPPCSRPIHSFAIHQFHPKLHSSMTSITSGLQRPAALFALWAWGCVAQVTPYTSATSSAPAQTHTISVGIDHKFKPDVTQAEVGDIISFQFFPPNHSVVRAEYEFPCIPYEMTGRGKTGFFSGFRPVDAILNVVSGLVMIASTWCSNFVRSLQAGQSKSTILIRYSCTAQLQDPVSHMEWSASSIL